jgi:hypothetical protein
MAEVTTTCARCSPDGIDRAMRYGPPSLALPVTDTCSKCGGPWPSPLPQGTTLEHDPDSGCRTCPLSFTWGRGTLSCASGGRDTTDERPAPAWCPLRAGPVTVRRKERET